jgi:hypothetical protein
LFLLSVVLFVVGRSYWRYRKNQAGRIASRDGAANHLG